MNWHAIFAALAVVFLLWYGTRFFSSNRNLFSAENLSKSFWTLGLLALFLIVVVGFLIMMSRH